MQKLPKRTIGSDRDNKFNGELRCVPLSMFYRAVHTLIIIYISYNAWGWSFFIVSPVAWGSSAARVACEKERSVARWPSRRELEFRLQFLWFWLRNYGDFHPKLLNVAVWQLLNQLGSKILLRFPFVIGRREAGFDCTDIWHSPIPVWQLPYILLAENILYKQLVDMGVETLPK
jgi:hypothetical protein